MIEVNAEFTVVDEGDGWIVVNKAAPLIVHPANNRGEEPSLLGGVKQYLAYDIECGAKLSLINRLDRETSGLVLIAKHKSVAREMSRAMERRLIRKKYQAIVFGWPEWDEILVDQPILRKGDICDSAIYVEQMVHTKGRVSETKFKVKQRTFIKGRKVSLMDVEPLTGRMHQIRVHAAFVGFPLVGDKIYNQGSEYLRFIENGMDDMMLNSLLHRRHALNACSLALELEEGSFSWEIALASDLKGLLESSTI